VQEAAKRFEERGVRVVAIGQGTGEEAAQYCGRAEIDFDCLGDPTRQAYKSQGMRRGNLWNVMLKGMVTRPFKALSLLREADLKAAALKSSDTLQLGGVAIVDSGGIIRYRHVAEQPDDIPSNEEIFRALDTLES